MYLVLRMKNWITAQSNSALIVAVDNWSRKLNPELM